MYSRQNTSIQVIPKLVPIRVPIVATALNMLKILNTGISAELMEALILMLPCTLKTWQEVVYYQSITWFMVIGMGQNGKIKQKKEVLLLTDQEVATLQALVFPLITYMHQQNRKQSVRIQAIFFMCLLTSTCK